MQAVVSEQPFACTWLQTEDRTPLVRLRANPSYWDSGRGPHLEEIVFRNDIPKAEALRLVCDTEGEIDMVTEVSPADAARVESSQYAKLVVGKPMRVIVGILNRDDGAAVLRTQAGRLAQNYAIDRDALVRDSFFGHAEPLGSLTPPSVVSFLHRLTPYAHIPDRAAKLWAEAGGTGNDQIRIAALPEFEVLARQIADQLKEALGLQPSLRIYTAAETLDVRRKLATRERPRDWDILLFEQSGQVADAPALEFHRTFVGETGEFCAGPVIPEFEELYKKLVSETSPLAMAHTSYLIDKFVYDQALALFVCAPEALYAVNRHVTFTPYKTSFELAECKVSEKHWSRKTK